MAIAHLSQTSPGIVVTHPLFAIWHSTHALHFGGILNLIEMAAATGGCSYYFCILGDCSEFGRLVSGRVGVFGSGGLAAWATYYLWRRQKWE